MSSAPTWSPRSPRRAGERFDWVFLDPPYAERRRSSAALRLARGSPRSAPGVVVAEHDCARGPPTAAAGSR